MQIGYLPGEGYCDPYLLGSFFARCAKMQGAEMRQGSRSHGITFFWQYSLGSENPKGNYS